MPARYPVCVQQGGLSNPYVSPLRSDTEAYIFRQTLRNRCLAAAHLDTTKPTQYASNQDAQLKTQRKTRQITQLDMINTEVRIDTNVQCFRPLQSADMSGVEKPHVGHANQMFIPSRH